MTLNKVWDEHLSQEFSKGYFKELWETAYEESSATLPPKEEVFTAYQLTDLPDVKVVILGQDPYPTPGNAHGLAFSVKPGVAVPASLLNIYKELQAEIPEFQIPTNGNLMSWAKQGVFLLNRVLTVQACAANSHKGLGWETFTRHTIEAIDREVDDVVYLLWGKNALGCADYLSNPKRKVLIAPHPSPLSASRGFFRCAHFTQANEYLVAAGKTPINWCSVMQPEI